MISADGEDAQVRGPTSSLQPTTPLAISRPTVEWFVDGWDHDDADVILLSALITEALCLSRSEGLRQY